MKIKEAYNTYRNVRFARFPNASGISPIKLQLTNFLQNSKMGNLIDKIQLKMTN
jgi:hypothetical protein